VSIRLLDYCKHPLTLENYFEWNKNTIGLIHLGNTINSGYGLGEHGAAYSTEEDIELLKEFIALYEKYEFSCPITIEVYEKDYSKCINYEETYNNLFNLYLGDKIII
jgi:hypothetical protein